MEYIRLRKINKDELILITMGYYSDRSVDGAFIALKDFDVEEELKEWLELNPDHEYRPNMFLSFLVVTKKVLEPMCCIQLSLGDVDNKELEMEETKE